MPRDIPLGNGTLLVNFDHLYQLCDIYWPHVGQENHTSGHIFRFGVWVDGQFEWTSGDGWRRTLDYADHTLVTGVTREHDGFGLRLECADTVDFHENLYVRRVIVRNNSDKPHEVRLFFG